MNTQLRGEKAATDQQARRAQANEEKALGALEVARQAISEMLIEFTRHEFARVPGAEIAVRNLLQRAAGFTSQLAALAPEEPRLRWMLGSSYRELGLVRAHLSDHAGALADLREAERVQRDS
jgi:hypothetical protein